jgi:hypothetical protein
VLGLVFAEIGCTTSDELKCMPPLETVEERADFEGFCEFHGLLHWVVEEGHDGFEEKDNPSHCRDDGNEKTFHDSEVRDWEEKEGEDDCVNSEDALKGVIHFDSHSRRGFGGGCCCRLRS